jgi:hypothetical protein
MDVWEGRRRNVDDERERSVTVRRKIREDPCGGIGGVCSVLTREKG